MYDQIVSTLAQEALDIAVKFKMALERDDDVARGEVEGLIRVLRNVADTAYRDERAASQKIGRVRHGVVMLDFSLTSMDASLLYMGLKKIVSSKRRSIKRGVGGGAAIMNVVYVEELLDRLVRHWQVLQKHKPDAEPSE